MTSAQDKVQAALSKGWQMAAEAKAAAEKAQDARNAYNLLKGQQQSDPYQVAGESRLSAKTAQLTSIHDKAVSAAQAQLDKAKEAFEAAKALAKDKLDKAVEDATAAWRVELDKRNQELDIEAAKAQAVAKEQEDKYRALKTSLERFLQMTQSELGVDLRKLVDN